MVCLAPSTVCATALAASVFYFRLDMRFGLAMAALLAAMLVGGQWVAAQTLAVWLATGIGLFYIIQSVPPIQMIVPGVLIALVVGILIALCIVALGGMALIVSRPNMGSILRLQSDE